jgi:hypothetical protein
LPDFAPARRANWRRLRRHSRGDRPGVPAQQRR